MIGFIQGKVLDHQDGKVLVGVGDRQGGGVVGYLVSVPPHSRYEVSCAQGNEVELFVYTHVREDAFDLFGFLVSDEKQLFLTLLNVNGIGPKSALGILGAIQPNDLIEAIVAEDQALLTRIPGIGKKTAERLVVELRDVVKKKLDRGVFAHINQTKVNAINPRSLEKRAVYGDAKAALIGLGYREQDIQMLLARLTQETEFHQTEDLIKLALKQLSM